MFPDSQNTSPEKHGQTWEAAHSFLLWHNRWVRRNPHTSMVSCENPFESSRASFIFNLLTWVTWNLGVQAETPRKERFGGLIAYSVPQQQLKQVRDLWTSWSFLIGWFSPTRFNNAHWLVTREESPQHVHDWS